MSKEGKGAADKGQAQGSNLKLSASKTCNLSYFTVYSPFGHGFGAQRTGVFETELRTFLLGRVE
jgi:hypothetical protein